MANIANHGETLNPIDKDELVTDIFRQMEIVTDPQELWDPAFKLALAEEQTGGKPETDKYPDISIAEIAEFRDKVSKLKTHDERYAASLVPTKSGRLWYDVLMGDVNEIMFEPVKLEVKRIFEKTHQRWDKAADLGSGTGNTLRSIAPFCSHIYGVDLSNLSLRTASAKLPDNASLLQAKADHLPFTDQSMDLVVSNGLIYYLSASEVTQFAREVYRVIKPGGNFYFSYIVREKDEIVPRSLRVDTTSAKQALLSVLESIVNGGGHPESPYPSEFNKILIENGFQLSNLIEDQDNKILLEYVRASEEG